MTFKSNLPAGFAEKFEEALSNIAKKAGLIRFEIIWTDFDVSLFAAGILCTGFDFSINPSNGNIFAEVKPPQDLSPLLRGH